MLKLHSVVLIVVLASVNCQQSEFPTSTSPTVTETSTVNNTTTTESSPSTTETETPVSDEEKSIAVAKLQKGDTSFSNIFLYRMLQENQNKSFATSGLSILFILGQLAGFSQGSTREQLLNVTGLATNVEIESSYGEIIKRIDEQQSNNTIEVNNKVYADEKYPLNNVFSDFSKNVFEADSQNIDFSKSKEAAATINKWIAENTNNKIQNLVSPDMFNDSTCLVLVNTIYFLGNWQYPFKSENTKNEDFYLENNITKTVPMMNQKSTSMQYTEDIVLKSQILQMPYKGQNFTYVIILPSNETSVLEVGKKLVENTDKWYNILNSLKKKSVDVTIPKMEIKTNIDLSDILKKIDLDAMFDPNSHPFIDILKDPKQTVYVSSAVQQVYMKVDEKGTEAAAASAFFGARATAIQIYPVTIPFKANRPFLHYILFQGIPIFSAAYYGPE